MIRTLARLHRSRARGDEGIAMILVMGSMVALSLLVFGTMAVALGGQTQGRNEQDWNSALAAAQAGVDDYAAKLNANANYWKTVDCANVALQGPKAGTNSCGWTTSTKAGWKNVEAGDSQSAQFHYDVDASGGGTARGIKLVVTGKSRNETRTLQVKVGKEGSTRFVYYTDFESADPANRTAYPPNGSTSVQCGSNGPAQARYMWSSPSRSGCSEITFAAADVLDGRVHFNDTPRMSNGATFLKGFETADPDCQSGTRANNWSGCTQTGRPNIPNGEVAEYAGALYLPDNSDELLTATGCHYTGDTRIRFKTNGKMQVWSKGTVGQPLEPGCGTPTNAGLGAAGGQEVDVPAGNIVYAKNKGGQHQCAAGEIGDGLPLANDVNFQGSGNATFYCGNGNMYVEGTVGASVGIGAQNNVIVTGDILLSGVAKGATPTGPNLVSLIASNSVVIYHPVERECTRYWSNGTCRTWGGYSNILPNTDRAIYASIQTLQRSFWVQGYNEGSKVGDLLVFGSIAQRWRGIVGTGGTSGTGYIKDYRYDSRLTYESPPGILAFTNGSWGTTVTGEATPAYGCTPLPSDPRKSSCVAK